MKSHTRGLYFCPAAREGFIPEQVAQLLSPVPLLMGCKTFSKSLHLSSPPLKMWEILIFFSKTYG